jgi:hypothetical protein
LNLFRHFSNPALIATIAICALLEIFLLAFVIWLAENWGRGFLYYLIGGGPATLFVAPKIYDLMKKRRLEDDWLR